MIRLTRDGTAEPVSRDQILRHVRAQGNIYFPCSADHEQDWQPYPVDLYSATCDDHTYVDSLKTWVCGPPHHKKRAHGVSEWQKSWWRVNDAYNTSWRNPRLTAIFCWASVIYVPTQYWGFTRQRLLRCDTCIAFDTGPRAGRASGLKRQTQFGTETSNAVESPTGCRRQFSLTGLSKREEFLRADERS